MGEYLMLVFSRHARAARDPQHVMGRWKTARFRVQFMGRLSSTGHPVHPSGTGLLASQKRGQRLLNSQVTSAKSIRPFPL